MDKNELWMADYSYIVNRIKFPQMELDRAIQDLSFEVLYAYESSAGPKRQYKL